MEMGEDPTKEERVSKGAWITMIAIVVGLVLVATYANWQKADRDNIETTTVTRFTPEPSASSSPLR
jgi:drug/metabolite transporter (DMT)-like permease